MGWHRRQSDYGAKRTTRELVAVAMGEAAAAEFQRPSDPARINFCALQMLAELAATDTIDKPLPKPVKSK